MDGGVGASRVQLFMVVLCIVAACQVLIMYGLEDGSGATQDPISDIKAKLKEQARLEAEKGETEDDMDASALGSLFPALKHMVGHKKSKAPVPEIQNLATTEANGLHIEISSLQDHLKSRLKVLENGGANTQLIRELVSDLHRTNADIREVEKRHAHRKKHSRIDLLYNETMNVRSAGSQYEALGGPTGWLAKFRAAVSSGPIFEQGLWLCLLMRVLGLRPGVYVELRSAEAETDSPISFESSLSYMRDHLGWSTVGISTVERRSLESITSDVLRQRCRESRDHIMCRQVVTHHNVLEILRERIKPRVSDIHVLSSYFGTVDLYLLQAILQAGYSPAIINVAHNRNFGVSDAFVVQPEAELLWASDCYFGAAPLALQRILKHYLYTLVGEDEHGTTLLFVRNDLLPNDAWVASLETKHWLSQVVRARSALHSPCRHMEWIRVADTGFDSKKMWEHSEAEHVVLDHVPFALGSQSAAENANLDADSVRGAYWALNALQHVEVGRRWVKVEREACEEEDTLQHAGTLVRRVDPDGTARWHPTDGNMMLSADFNRRHQNFVELTSNMTSAGGQTGKDWFSRNWHTSVSCTTEIRVGDRWICDPHRIRKCGCIVFSFGTRQDFAVERDIHRRNPQCKIHAFSSTDIENVEPPDGVFLHPTPKLRVEPERWHGVLRTSARLLGVPGLLGSGPSRRKLDVLLLDLQGQEREMLAGAAGEEVLAGLADQVLASVSFPLADAQAAALRLRSRRQGWLARKEKQLQRITRDLVALRARARAATPAEQASLEEEVEHLAKRLQEAMGDEDHGTQQLLLKDGESASQRLKQLADALHAAGYAVFAKEADLEQITGDDIPAVKYSFVSNDFLPFLRPSPQKDR